MSKVWTENNEIFYLQNFTKRHTRLDNHIFILEEDPMGNKYLKRIGNKFDFDYKIYGLESGLIARISKTYTNTQGNLGVLLNGLKGTGKTVTSKIICNELNQPAIIVDKNLVNGHIYLNDIPQDITIFIDEYEKIFKDDSEMLTIMDGALNSDYRRFFILTTNNLYVNDNLLQRPSRIRYLKTFRDLSPNVIKEITEDSLIHKNFMDDVISFISTLEIITVDVVKAICKEVNIHNESPDNFSDVFNVKKLTGKYDVFMIKDEKEILVVKDVKVSPRKDFSIDGTIGCSFYINDRYLGEIKSVENEETIVVECRVDDKSHLFNLLNNGNNYRTISRNKKIDSGIEPGKIEEIEEYDYVTFRIENSITRHRHYSWGNFNI